MICYRDDPDYAAAFARRAVVSIEIAELTNQLDKIQVKYLRDKIHTPAYIRADLTEQRSALRLEEMLLADAMLTIKSRHRQAVRQDLLQNVIDVLNETNMEHVLKTAITRRDAA